MINVKMTVRKIFYMERVYNNSWKENKSISIDETLDSK